MQLTETHPARVALEHLVTLFADTDLTPAQQCKAADAIWVLGELVDLLEK
jgi:hypothetical protein